MPAAVYDHVYMCTRLQRIQHVVLPDTWSRTSSHNFAAYAERLKTNCCFAGCYCGRRRNIINNGNNGNAISVQANQLERADTLLLYYTVCNGGAMRRSLQGRYRSVGRLRQLAAAGSQDERRRSPARRRTNRPAD
jgi:hypothetical protein